jgi:glycosyltransferase involved in cell wall biosynthesis
MEDPAITAVIALHDGAEFIEDALNSVFAQTHPPARTIVVDDGSADEGPAIVEQMGRAHDVLLIRKQNGGQSSARNLGISHATTPLIALLDQDDIWYPHHLERLVVPFRDSRYPALGWVYSNIDEIDRDGNMVTRCLLDTFHGVEHPKRTLTGCLARDMYILPSASLIGRDAFERVGGFDERLVGYEDDDLFLRMFRSCYDNVYLPDSLTKWRIFTSSTSFSPHMARSRMIYFHKLLGSLPENRRGTKYVEDLLAPRFLRACLSDYRRVLGSENKAERDFALENMKCLLPHLNPGIRLVTRAALPLGFVIGPPPIGHLARKIAPVVRSAYRFAAGRKRPA